MEVSNTKKGHKHHKKPVKTSKSFPLQPIILYIYLQGIKKQAPKGKEKRAKPIIIPKKSRKIPEIPTKNPKDLTKMRF